MAGGHVRRREESTYASEISCPSNRSNWQKVETMVKRFSRSPTGDQSLVGVRFTARRTRTSVGPIDPAIFIELDQDALRLEVGNEMGAD